jgi:hypothetical protein
MMPQVYPFSQLFKFGLNATVLFSGTCYFVPWYHSQTATTHPPTLLHIAKMLLIMGETHNTALATCKHPGVVVRVDTI